MKNISMRKVCLVVYFYYSIMMKGSDFDHIKASFLIGIYASFCLHNIIIIIIIIPILSILQEGICSLIKLIEASNTHLSFFLLLSTYNRCIVQDQHLHSTVVDATKICVNIDVCIYVYSKLQLSEHFQMCVKNLSMNQWMYVMAFSSYIQKREREALHL